MSSKYVLKGAVRILLTGLLIFGVAIVFHMAIVDYARLSDIQVYRVDSGQGIEFDGTIPKE